MSSRPSSFVLTAPGPVRLFSTEELLTMPSPEWLIDGILPQGAVAALYGAPATFKSFVGIDIALSVASGLPWHGKAVQQGMVLYVAAEGSAGIAKRVRSWLTHYQVKPSKVDVAWAIEPLAIFAGSEGLEQLKIRLDDEIGSQPVLVVVDTLARCLEGDENLQKDMGGFIAGLDHLRHEYGTTVLVIHHTNLSGERERGSTALRGGMDTMIAIDRPTRTSPNIALECTKQKDTEAFPDLKLILHPVPDTESCVLITRPSDGRRDRILAVLRTSFDGMTFDQWFSSVETMSRSTFQKYYTELKESGEIIKENDLWRVLVRE